MPAENAHEHSLGLKWSELIYEEQRKEMESLLKKQDHQEIPGRNLQRSLNRKNPRLSFLLNRQLPPFDRMRRENSRTTFA